MMLVNKLLPSPITFEEGKINVLVIENQKMYTDLINELAEQLKGNEGSIVLSEDFSPLNLIKSAELILDIFNLELNHKKAINQIYCELSSICNNEEYSRFNNIKCEIMSFVNDVIEYSDHSLSYNASIDAADLFKIFDIRLDENNDCISEKLISYLKLHSSIFKIKCFVLVNIKTFLNKEELNALYKEINYNKLNVLLLENTAREKLPCEIIRIIDNDLCEIY